MKLILSSILAVTSFVALPLVARAGEPIQLAQVFYESFIDDYGRKILVDPDTGEIVEVISPEEQRIERRQTRRDRQQERRDGRRETWRERQRRRLSDIFGPEEDGVFRDDDDSFAEEELIRRERDSIERRTLPPPSSSDDDVPQQADDPLARENEVASLPPADEKPEINPTYKPIGKPKLSRDKMAELQVFLDRKGFSPGSIDGRWGSNVAKAVRAWQEASGETTDITKPENLDSYVQSTGGSAFTSYVITENDVAGPYVANVPVDYAKKAELENLSYTSIFEALAEKFHMSEVYLRQLNSGKVFRAGAEIKVVATGNLVSTPVHWIVADKANKQLRAYDRNGKLVTAYPATIGSAATPSPSGTHTVTRIAVNPEYTYNPKKNFQQGENDKILRIPPGPNGPVGSVWIALSKPTYGIHGTPQPDKIGKTNSHGCIRLTNWDARELVKIVRAGVTVEFR